MSVKSIILLTLISLAGAAIPSPAKGPTLKQTLEWLQVKTGKWYRETKNFSLKEYAILTQSWENLENGRVVYNIYANKALKIQYTFYLYDLDEKTVNVIPHNRNYYDVEVKTEEEKELIKISIQGSTDDYPWVNVLCFRINSRENAERHANALKHAIILSKIARNFKTQEEIF